MFNTEIAPWDGCGFAVAKFACWVPDEVRAIIVLTPGSNDDGRFYVNEKRWQQFAKLHKCALFGCYFTDKEPSWVETYVDAKRGSGQALLRALKKAGFDGMPLLLWGYSAGGEFNYEFTCWLAPQQPNRVRAFVVNKGGVYYTLLAPPEARAIPGRIYVGGRDADFRKLVLNTIYTVNYMAGCQWKLDVDPHISHGIGFSETDAMDFFATTLQGVQPT